MGRTFKSIVIDAPVDKVWNTVRDFHQFAWASDVFKKCEPVGDLKGTQVGCKRTLDDAVHETLLTLDDHQRTFRYLINDGPGPLEKSNIRDYVGEFCCYPITSNNTTFATWGSTWIGNDGPVTEFCNPVYDALLGALKKHCEG